MMLRFIVTVQTLVIYKVPKHLLGWWVNLKVIDRSVYYTCKWLYFGKSDGSLATKGQLISEKNFGVFKSPKK
jgi:hypothetical protein